MESIPRGRTSCRKKNPNCGGPPTKRPFAGEKREKVDLQSTRLKMAWILAESINRWFKKGTTLHLRRISLEKNDLCGGKNTSKESLKGGNGDGERRLQKIGVSAVRKKKLPKKSGNQQRSRTIPTPKTSTHRSGGEKVRGGKNWRKEVIYRHAPSSRNWDS